MFEEGWEEASDGPRPRSACPGGLTEPPHSQETDWPEAVRVGAVTALRLELVGAGHPRPCGTAPGRSKALGGGAAPASSARVRAVLLNALLRDFTEMMHGKDPGSVRWELRIRVAGSSSGAFSCADSHWGGGCPCTPASLRPSPASAWRGQWPQVRDPPPLGLTLTGGQASRPELLLRLLLPPVRAGAQGAPGSPALRTPFLPPSLEPQLFFTLSHISFCLRPALPAFTCRMPNSACVLSCFSRV